MTKQELLRAVDLIEPSPVSRRVLQFPVRILLRNQALDPAYVIVTDSRAEIVRQMNALSKQHRIVLPEAIVGVQISKHRLPLHISQQIASGGESSPDVWVYDLTLRNREVLTYASSGDFDFPRLPEGVIASDVVAARKVDVRKTPKIFDYADIPVCLLLDEERAGER